MLFRTAANYRPYHLGGYPLETLPRDDSILEKEAARPRASAPAHSSEPAGPLASAVRTYLQLFIANGGGEPAARPAQRTAGCC